MVTKVETEECVVCQEGLATKRWIDWGIPYGWGEDEVRIPAHFPVWKCDTCKLEYTDHEAEAIKQEAVEKYLEEVDNG